MMDSVLQVLKKALCHGTRDQPESAGEPVCFSSRSRSTKGDIKRAVEELFK